MGWGMGPWVGLAATCLGVEGWWQGEVSFPENHGVTENQTGERGKMEVGRGLGE